MESQMPDRTIGIAVVIENGSVLVGVRSSGTPLAGMHEFPGGKCQAKENAEQCAARECEEETGLHVSVKSRLKKTEFTYDHGTLELNFFHCQLIDSDIGNRQSDYAEQMKPLAPFEWVPIQDLPTLNFPAGNDAVIELLQQKLKQS